MAINPNFDDDDSIASLKSWWASNGKQIVAGLIAGIVVAGGWWFFDQQSEQRLTESSALYTKLVSISEEEDEGEIKWGEMSEITALMTANYADTPYAPLSLMLMARYFVDADNLDKAKESLLQALELANDQDINFLHSLIAVRVARIMIAQGQTREASNFLLEQDFPRGLTSLSNEVVGDALAAQDLQQQALDLYRSSEEDLADPTGYLRMKMQRLGAQ